VVCAAMRRAMHIMNARGEMAARGEECLSVRVYLRVGRSRDYAIKIVVGHHFHQTRVSVGKGNAQRQDLIVAVRSSARRSRRACLDVADHYSVDRVRWRRAE